MGTWGIGAFENDDATDWLLGLGKPSWSGELKDSFTKILDGSRELTDCCYAVAAAELVSSKMVMRHGLPADAMGWLEAQHRKPGKAICRLLHRALDAILKDSELQALWYESDSYGDWYEVLRSSQVRTPHLLSVVRSQPTPQVSYDSLAKIGFKPNLTDLDKEVQRLLKHTGKAGIVVPGQEVFRNYYDTRDLLFEFYIDSNAIPPLVSEVCKNWAYELGYNDYFNRLSDILVSQDDSKNLVRIWENALRDQKRHYNGLLEYKSDLQRDGTRFRNTRYYLLNTLKRLRDAYKKNGNKNDADRLATVMKFVRNMEVA